MFVYLMLLFFVFSSNINLKKSNAQNTYKNYYANSKDSSYIKGMLRVYNPDLSKKLKYIQVGIWDERYYIKDPNNWFQYIQINTRYDSLGNILFQQKCLYQPEHNICIDYEETQLVIENKVYFNKVLLTNEDGVYCGTQWFELKDFNELKPNNEKQKVYINELSDYNDIYGNPSSFKVISRFLPKYYVKNKKMISNIPEYKHRW